MVELGAVRVVPDDDARVRSVRAGAGWATPAGQRWLAQQTAALAAHGGDVQTLPLHRGWYALAVRPPGAPVRLLALPPTFPVAPPRLLRPAPAGGWQGEPVPSRGKHWDAYQLPDLLMADDGRRTTDDGRRTTDDGRRTTDDGRRTTDDGRLIADG